MLPTVGLNPIAVERAHVYHSVSPVPNNFPRCRGVKQDDNSHRNSLQFVHIARVLSCHEEKGSVLGSSEGSFSVSYVTFSGVK